MSEKTAFNELYHLDVTDKVEKKKAGKNYLSYLSWAWAWAETKKRFPNAQYKIKKFENNLPYVFDPQTGYMVFTEVTIEDVTHEMWLPVMDGANKAMKDKPYKYMTKYNGEKTADAATMFDVNKTIMRCLTKNLAMFGLGLHLFAGEDLPEVEPVKSSTKEQRDEFTNLITEYMAVKGIEGQKAYTDMVTWALKQVNAPAIEKTNEQQMEAVINKMKEIIKASQKSDD